MSRISWFRHCLVNGCMLIRFSARAYLLWEPCDGWVGVYVKRRRQRLGRAVFVCLLPCLPVVFLQRRPELERD